MRPVQFVDGSGSQHVQNGLSNLCKRLRQWGFVADWCPRVEEASPGCILFLHDPVNESSIPEGCVALGQRTLNRRQRLVLAEQYGLPVPRWRSLDNQNQIASLFDEWNVNHFLYKADWSYSRAGIRLMRPDNVISLGKFDSDGDVFMEVLEGCPHTFKVDVAFDQIIACRKLFTRSVFDRKFRNGFAAPSMLSEVRSLQTELRNIGKAAFDYGVGLMNVDIMIDGYGKSWVIELNTCSVGREATWKRWPDIYIDGYANGVARWMTKKHPGLCSSDPTDRAGNLAKRSGGVRC